MTVDYYGFQIPKGEADFLWAIGEHESGGRYTAVNSSSGALGKYQVLPSNVPEWTKEALGHSLTPQQYLADPHAQDAVAVHILGRNYQHHGVLGASSIWYVGHIAPASYMPGGANTETVGEYAAGVREKMAHAPKRFRAKHVKGGNFATGTSLADFQLPTSASEIPGFMGQHVVLVVAVILLFVVLRK